MAADEGNLQKGTHVDLSDLNGHWSNDPGASAGLVDGGNSNSPLSVSRGNAEPTNICNDPVRMGMR